MDSNHGPFHQHVLLFDGVCNLCNGTVQVLLRIDRRKKLRFASLQSKAAAEILIRSHYPGQSLETVVFSSKGKLFTHSDAILEVVKVIGFPWSLLYIFKVVPSALRNAIYRWIARNRYRWFGKKIACWVPTPELQQRFLS